MFFPIGDSPNPVGRPFVNYLLIALNVAVYVLVTLPSGAQPVDPANPVVQVYLDALRDRGYQGPVQVSAYDLIVFQWGFRPADPSLGALFASLFLHGGLMHLAGNMLFLWIYGDNVELRLGRLRYIVAYLGAGVAATLFHAAFARSSNIPMVGASGAISGVLGFYYLFFPRNRVKVALVLPPFLFDVWEVPARFVLGAYLLLDNVLPFLISSGAGAGIAHGAHIGGFIAGLAAAWLIDTRERTAKPDDPGLGSPVDPALATLDRVPQLVRAGRHADAARIYFAASAAEQRRIPSATALELGRWLGESGHPNAALTLFRRVLHQRPPAAVAAVAHVGCGLVQLRALDRPTAAWQHFLEAIDLAPQSDAARTAREGLRAIEALKRSR